MKERCCPATPFRKATCSIREAAREEERRIATAPAYKQSRRERKKVEMLFAHLERVLTLDRMRLRDQTVCAMKSRWQQPRKI